jgi:hypothetical protein
MHFIFERHYPKKCVSKKSIRVCTNPNTFFTYTLYGILPTFNLLQRFHLFS